MSETNSTNKKISGGIFYKQSCHSFHMGLDISGRVALAGARVNEHRYTTIPKQQLLSNH